MVALFWGCWTSTGFKGSKVGLLFVFFHVSKENSWRTLEFQPNFLAITLNTLLNLGNLT